MACKTTWYKKKEDPAVFILAWNGGTVSVTSFTQTQHSCNLQTTKNAGQNRTPLIAFEIPSNKTKVSFNFYTSMSPQVYDNIGQFLYVYGSNIVIKDDDVFANMDSFTRIYNDVKNGTYSGNWSISNLNVSGYKYLVIYSTYPRADAYGQNILEITNLSFS